MAKKHFGPKIGSIGPNLGPQIFFFVGFTSSYHCMQFQGKSFGPDLARLAQF